MVPQDLKVLQDIQDMMEILDCQDIQVMMDLKENLVKTGMLVHLGYMGHQD